ncbi:hypothetical protein V6N12_032677 [Hibiscus sabdariffa]|uniref:Uncharacterized protein n=1 Tax=Hibiscus sabdariffa TaxID=183260 RepID=A0ABR2BNF1_9ROSI
MEIKDVIFAMNGNKAPGPDGYTAMFIQAICGFVGAGVAHLDLLSLDPEQSTGWIWVISAGLVEQGWCRWVPNSGSDAEVGPTQGLERSSLVSFLCWAGL